MKIVITENRLEKVLKQSGTDKTIQCSIYLKRRYTCMREYVDQLKSGEELLTVPTSSFKWDTYK